MQITARAKKGGNAGLMGRRYADLTANLISPVNSG